MRKTFSFFTALSLLSAASIVAENAVILEDFEDNIDSATPGDWGGARIPDGVALSHYTKAGDDDLNVTHGKKSLQIDLSVAEYWVMDWKVTLSDDASQKLHDAIK